MTQEEKAKSLWYHFCTEKNCEGHSICTQCPKAKIHPQLIEMAEWKDKQYNEEKKKLVEKMSKWILENINKPLSDDGYIFYVPPKGLHEDIKVYCAAARFVEDLKNFMEGE